MPSITVIETNINKIFVDKNILMWFECLFEITVRAIWKEDTIALRITRKRENFVKIHLFLIESKTHKPSLTPSNNFNFDWFLKSFSW